MTTVNQVKYNLSFYLPSLMKIVGGFDLDWTHIDSLFSKKIADRLTQSNGQTIFIEATVYDIIVEVKKQNLKQYDFWIF